jgi:hypothetical protein
MCAVAPASSPGIVCFKLSYPSRTLYSHLTSSSQLSYTSCFFLQIDANKRLVAIKLTTGEDTGDAAPATAVAEATEAAGVSAGGAEDGF